MIDLEWLEFKGCYKSYERAIDTANYSGRQAKPLQSIDEQVMDVWKLETKDHGMVPLQCMHCTF